MNRLRRWLAFKLSRTLTTMDPQHIDSTFDMVNPDARRRTMMHLVRGADALVIPAACWELVVVLAASDGGWQPTGTSAAATDFGGQRPAKPGHYIPARQTIADSDARALAAGLRRAEHTAQPDVIGASARKVPLGWWMARDGDQATPWSVDGEQRFIGVAAPQMARYWDLWAQMPQIAAFLEQGGCRIMPGLPQKVLDDDKERERRWKIEQETKRLEAEIAESPATKLARLRAELAHDDVRPMTHSSK